MQSLLTTLVYGFLGLLALAVLVAAWEHLRRAQAIALRLRPAASRAENVVDVDLVQLAENPAEGDLAQRQTTAHAALVRAARPAADHRPWTETRPMVAPGSAEKLDR